MLNKFLCWMWGHQFKIMTTKRFMNGYIEGMSRTVIYEDICKHCEVGK